MRTTAHASSWLPQQSERVQTIFGSSPLCLQRQLFVNGSPLEYTQMRSNQFFGCERIWRTMEICHSCEHQGQLRLLLNARERWLNFCAISSSDCGNLFLERFMQFSNEPYSPVYQSHVSDAPNTFASLLWQLKLVNSRSYARRTPSFGV